MQPYLYQSVCSFAYLCACWFICPYLCLLNIHAYVYILSVFLSVCVFACISPSVRLSICLSNCLGVGLYVCPFIGMAISLFICYSKCLSICLSPIPLSIHRFVCLFSIYSSVCPVSHVSFCSFSHYHKPKFKTLSLTLESLMETHLCPQNSSYLNRSCLFIVCGRWYKTFFLRGSCRKIR